MPRLTAGWKRRPALVGSEGAVELHAEAAVHVHLTAVVLPGHAEDDLPLRLAQPLDERLLPVVRVPLQHQGEGLQHLGDRLVELRLARVAMEDLLPEGLDLLLDVHPAAPDDGRIRRRKTGP